MLHKSEKFIVKRVSNMVFICDACDQVWKAWDEYEFTERKLANAIKKIQGCFNNPVTFTRNF